jgi:3-isopropylmalate/(R)-2-methylmalate dehydratase large subunit
MGGPPARTLFDKIWDAHLVVPETDDAPAILYVDLHLVHEVTSPQAFAELHERGLRVRRPKRTLATMDHSTPTTPHVRLPLADAQAQAQLDALEANCREHGIELYALGDERQGIVHVVAPERGRTRPGMTIVCGDSHTSTHGAFGALAFGIGTTEVGHVMATQCLALRRPRTMLVRIDGRFGDGVSAKDVALALIARIGVGGGTGHVIEYAGSAVRAMSMEERMTLCNMSIEAGARAGMIAPDETTLAWLRAAPDAARGRDDEWHALSTDEGARFDRDVALDVSALEPMITYGTDPSAAIGVRDVVPDPRGDATRERALRYMDIVPGRPLLGRAIDVVFIGSCTNSRLGDLRAAARVMAGRKVASGVRALVVPGSQRVKRDAEAEGLDRIFRDAGAEWRDSGCSMCIAMNGDALAPGQYAVSTSNRNFEGRQGAGGRTFLASPLTAAAAAVTGTIADVRDLL